MLTETEFAAHVLQEMIRISTHACFQILLNLHCILHIRTNMTPWLPPHPHEVGYENSVLNLKTLACTVHKIWLHRTSNKLTTIQMS